MGDPTEAVLEEELREEGEVGAKLILMLLCSCWMVKRGCNCSRRESGLAVAERRPRLACLEYTQSKLKK